MVLTGSTFDERGTNAFREMLNGALSGEGTMSINMDISWGGNNGLQNIIHVAAAGTASAWDSAMGLLPSIPAISPPEEQSPGLN